MPLLSSPPFPWAYYFFILTEKIILCQEIFYFILKSYTNIRIRKTKVTKNFVVFLLFYFVTCTVPGYQRLLRRPKCGLLAMTVGGRPLFWESSLRWPSSPSLLRACALSLPRYCEGYGSSPWQSLEVQPQYSPKPSLRACVSRRGNLSFGVLHSRSCGLSVPEIATSPKIRAPRNNKWGTPAPWTTEIASSLRSSQ